MIMVDPEALGRPIPTFTKPKQLFFSRWRSSGSGVKDSIPAISYVEKRFGGCGDEMVHVRAALEGQSGLLEGARDGACAQAEELGRVHISHRDSNIPDDLPLEMRHEIGKLAQLG